ncbi:hypothetical protein BKA70DRAFT_1452226 [Coprinopsis sp. MPI-PUGE-AT-0042]|nr:hypothetical protein BKA70DRAFT_1452226 [Coprinopsis sp. MPI-PUGE-AT-0042]
MTIPRSLRMDESYPPKAPSPHVCAKSPEGCRDDPATVLDLDLRSSSGRSSILELPPEVLACIFELVTSIVPLHYDEISPPWNIGGVCRSWKELVDVNPFLWTNICINEGAMNWPFNAKTALDDSNFTADNTIYPTRLSAFLARSRGLPLQVRIQHSTSAWLPEALEFKRREEQFRLTGSLSAEFLFRLQELCCLPSDTFPHLTTLRDEMDGLCYFLAWSQTKFLFPSLQTVGFHSIPYRVSDTFKSFLEWIVKLGRGSTLRSLHFEGGCTTPETIFLLYQPQLKTIPSLRSVSIRGEGAHPIRYNTRLGLLPPSILPSVETLTVSGFTNNLVENLDRLIPLFPGLRQNTEDALTSSMIVFRSFPEGLMGAVQSLSLTGFQEEVIPRVVKLIPNLKRLSVFRMIGGEEASLRGALPQGLEVKFDRASGC